MRDRPAGLPGDLVVGQYRHPPSGPVDEVVAVALGPQMRDFGEALRADLGAYALDQFGRDVVTGIHRQLNLVAGTRAGRKFQMPSRVGVPAPSAQRDTRPEQAVVVGVEIGGVEDRPHRLPLGGYRPHSGQVWQRASGIEVEFPFPLANHQWHHAHFPGMPAAAEAKLPPESRNGLSARPCRRSPEENCRWGEA